MNDYKLILTDQELNPGLVPNLQMTHMMWPWGDCFPYFLPPYGTLNAIP